MNNSAITSRYLSLAPGVNALLRSSNSIQFGLNPKTALVVPLELAHDLLEFLDGTMTGDQIIETLEENEFASEKIASTLVMLFERGLIIDANDSSRRAAHIAATPDSELSVIEIQGGGRMGTTLAVLLSTNPLVDVRMVDRTPVTVTDVIPWGATRIDIGQSRQTVADLLVERTRRGTIAKRIRPSLAKQPDLVVMCPQPVADWPWTDPLIFGPLISNDQPHMTVTSSANGAHVSHIVEPGENACFLCIQHTFADRDPLWPSLTHQLHNRTTPDDAPIELITMGAVIAAQKIGTWVAARHKLENPLPSQHHSFSMIEWPSLTREDSEPKKHPLCGCSWDGQLHLVGS